jgi:hypothetical protein
MQEDFAIKATNIDWFYEEKEKSQRVFRMHYGMNMAWKYLTYCSVSIAIWAIYTAQQQQKDMWNFAGKVVAPIERRGGETSKNEDGTIKV